MPAHFETNQNWHAAGSATALAWVIEDQEFVKVDCAKRGAVHGFGI